MANWLSAHASSVTVWCAALCTFAIYSVLYAENKFYRLFEHIFIGIAAGYGVYLTWAQVLAPKWWQPMAVSGYWYWVLAAVVGSMFYFMYSHRHVWISRVIFGLFMGLAAGGIFREFYETYFPQIGSSMKAVVGHTATGQNMTVGQTANVLIFYAMLFASMTYFFFSFEHGHVVVRKTAAAGRWFLMIGFGAIFGATVMGRMTLFIGRVNFVVNDWWPEVAKDWSHGWFRIVVALVALLCAGLVVRRFRSRRPQAPYPPSIPPS